MNSKENHIPEVSARLFGLDKKLTMLANLYKLKKFPKVLMLTGDKGVGKFTLACHFLHFVFDQENYDLKDNIINDKTDFHLKYQTCPGNHFAFLSKIRSCSAELASSLKKSKNDTPKTKRNNQH